MVSRAIHFLLLTSFLFWATGAAQFLHELTDHHPSPARTVSAHSNAFHPDSPSKPSHDHCAICAALAGMTPCALPAIHFDPALHLVQLLPRLRYRTPSTNFIPFPLSRGPPIQSPALSA